MNIDKKVIKIYQLILSALIIFFCPLFVYAYEYTLLEKIPGFEGVSTNLPEYINAIYKFGLWTIGIAALLMITLGGFMYITSAGNSSSTGKAKKFITDAIAGLILAFIAYLLLKTLNPDLLEMNLQNFK